MTKNDIRFATYLSITNVILITILMILRTIVLHYIKSLGIIYNENLYMFEQYYLYYNTVSEITMKALVCAIMTFVLSDIATICKRLSDRKIES